MARPERYKVLNHLLKKHPMDAAPKLIDIVAAETAIALFKCGADEAEEFAAAGTH